MKLTTTIREYAGFVLVALTTVSCDKNDDRLTVRDTEDVKEEALIDHYFQDMDDLSRLAVEAAGDETSGGRENTPGRTKDEIFMGEDRLACPNVVVSVVPDAGSTPYLPQGLITIDFKEGCTDKYGITRKGKLQVAYYGRRFQEGSMITITGENYRVNNVLLEGTRRLTNRSGSDEAAPRFNVILENGKATFPDGRVATREADRMVEWQRAANPVDDQLKVTGQASGTTRYGGSYTLNIPEELIYKRLCTMAVSGTKAYHTGGDKEITIDYGDGECDRSVSVTVNGTTRNLSI